jgi:hypothetical protein
VSSLKKIEGQRCVSGAQIHGHLPELEKELERPLLPLQMICVPI